MFVFVRDAKPKRKFAVPVPDGYTWAEFVSQVKAKLRITGVKEMYLASVSNWPLVLHARAALSRCPFLAEPFLGLGPCRAGKRSPVWKTCKTSTSCALLRWAEASRGVLACLTAANMHRGAI